MSEIWWTDERLDELRLRWINGETASQICRAMKATSRNAVVGKAYRLNLQTRATNLSGQVARKSNQARKRRVRMIEQLSRCNGQVGEPIQMPEEKPLPGYPPERGIP